MSALLSESQLASLGELFEQRMGWHFPRERWSDMRRALTAVAPALGARDARACAERLLSAPLTQRDVELLASYLTVGETYFFREPGGFDALEHVVLPPIVRQRAEQDRRLRIWSAGCCTGEEPYSIAILLDRVLPEPESWNLTLLATDINPSFLRRAAEAEYAPWSFRRAPEWLAMRYFRTERQARFRLSERIRARVSFAYLNLVDDGFPSLVTNTTAMDVIVCRNVLMYFAPERAQAVVDRFRKALLPGGWLVVGAAESSATLFRGFRTVLHSGAVLYRRDETEALHGHAPDADLSPTSQAHVEPAVTPEGPGKTWPRARTGRTVSQPPPALPASLRSQSKAGTPIAAMRAREVSDARAISDCEALASRARASADQGHLGEAADLCRQAIGADKLVPANYYLLALIQQEQGDKDAAAQSLVRALFLDPDFALARHALGNLRFAQGRTNEANRHFDHALGVLARLPPESTIAHAEGLSAARLAQLIKSTKSSWPHAMRPSYAKS